MKIMNEKKKMTQGSIENSTCGGNQSYLQANLMLYEGDDLLSDLTQIY